MFACGVAVGLLPILIPRCAGSARFLVRDDRLSGNGAGAILHRNRPGVAAGTVALVQLLEAAAVGPALIAAIEVTRRTLERAVMANPVRRAMLAASLGGLVGAGVNKPFQIFYPLPALPPLFVLAALMFSEGEKRPAWLKGAWALFLIIGLVPVATWFIRAANNVPALDAERRSKALAIAIRDQLVGGPVGTLAGQYVADVDPRFAAGPFLIEPMDLLISTRPAIGISSLGIRRRC